MSRLDRFKKLERARPDAPGGDRDENAGKSMRFGKIEARKDAPAKAAPDPFAPPPEDSEVPLEIAADDAADAERLRAERVARAQESLDREAQRQAELNMREEAHADRGLVDSLARRGNEALAMPTEKRLYVAGGVLAVTAVCALTISPIFWGLAPVVVLVFLASLWQGR